MFSEDCFSLFTYGVVSYLITVIRIWFGLLD